MAENKTLPTGNTITPTLADKVILGDADNGWRLGDAFLSAIKTLLVGGDIALSGVLSLNPITIDPDDTTPDVSGGNVFITSANTQATEITDLDNPTVGQPVILIGGSDTNASTIADSGNFTLSGAWTTNDGDVLVLYVRADNDYIEICRSDN